MLKNILKLDGAQELSKEMQKTVTGKGGRLIADEGGDLMACLCPSGQLVVAHGNSCQEIVNQFCGLEA